MRLCSPPPPWSDFGNGLTVRVGSNFGSVWMFSATKNICENCTLSYEMIQRSNDPNQERSYDSSDQSWLVGTVPRTCVWLCGVALNMAKTCISIMFSMTLLAR